MPVWNGWTAKSSPDTGLIDMKFSAYVFDVIRGCVRPVIIDHEYPARVYMVEGPVLRYPDILESIRFWRNGEVGPFGAD